ncbi:MAG TPA: hypothetical protein VMO81_08650 [Aestuariivirgaceae bacterium]|nr:hypothetical protein [Aestuariivirgaceae bacterium]
MTEQRKVRTCFWFARRGIDAAQFYVGLLPDSRIDAVFDHGRPDDPMVVERETHHFEQSLMPLLDRAHRMLVRSLDRLEARSSGGSQGRLSIGHAGQVNVGSAVRNGAG